MSPLAPKDESTILRETVTSNGNPLAELSLGKPMLLVSPIPGQEEHNAGFLMEEGAARLAYDEIGLDYKIARLMAAPVGLLGEHKYATSTGCEGGSGTNPFSGLASMYTKP